MDVIKPLPGIVFVAPYARQRNFVTKSGLHTSHQTKQGAPNTGRIVAVDAEEKELKPGMDVIFIENHPKGVHFNGQALLPIDRDKVGATVPGGLEAC